MKNVRVINELKAKRATHITALQDLAVKAADAPLDGDDKATYERTKTAIEEINAKITDMENYKDDFNGGATEKSSSEREGFTAFLRSGDRAGVRMSQVGKEFTAMDRSAGSAGAIVPTELADFIWKKATDASIFRQLCHVIPLNTDIDIPISGNKPKWNWTAEKGKIESSDLDLTVKSLKVNKAAGLVKASWELLNDSKFGIDEYIGGLAGEALAEFLEDAYLNNGAEETDKPCGIKAQASTLTSVTAGKITYKDIAKLYMQPKQNYRRNASFVASKDAIIDVMTLVDDNKRPIFTPGYALGQPDTLIGRPVHECAAMETEADKTHNMMFGDYKAYYIGDRQQMITQRLVELYAETGEVGFLFHVRTDGKLIDSEAVYVLDKQSAI